MTYQIISKGNKPAPVEAWPSRGLSASATQEQQNKTKRPETKQ